MIECPDAMCTRLIVQENTSIQDFYKPNKDIKKGEIKIWVIVMMI